MQAPQYPAFVGPSVRAVEQRIKPRHCIVFIWLLEQYNAAKEVLRRNDHAAIFLMIAATYTPFAANRLGHGTGVALLAAIWLCATVGVVLKLTFPRRFERLSVVFYLAMGWMILAVVKPLSAALASIDLWLLAAGGLVYSAGVFFFLAERLPFHKPLWHGFVLVAVALQLQRLRASSPHKGECQFGPPVSQHRSFDELRAPGPQLQCGVLGRKVG
jgi:channel protein (hemolysin III family)